MAPANKWALEQVLTYHVVPGQITAEELGPFGREAGGGNPMPRDLLAPVFELAVNATTMIERAQSFAVMQLLSVTPADLSGEAAALAALRSETAQAMAEDFEAQYQAALRARANVRINPRLLLWRERVADLETPVGSFLKLAHGQPHSFLLESVEGGAARGRFSAIGM
eukprot:gene18405-22528_t